MNLFKINSSEKNVQLFYLVFLWILFSVTFSVVVFRFHKSKEVRGGQVLLEQLKEQSQIAGEHKLNENHIDTLSRMLMQYNPGTSQVHLESGINIELSDLRKAYDKKKNNENYKIYYQIADLFDMYFFDKKGTWVSVNNNNSLKENLKECEIGFRENKQNVVLQEALKGQNKDNE